MTGATGMLVRKELRESWRTLRLPVVMGLFLVVGIGSPLLAYFLPEIVALAAQGELPPIAIPDPTAHDAVVQWWENVAQFGAFTAILLAMATVPPELERGTAAFVLSRPVSRPAFLAAKAVVLALTLAIGVVLAAVAGWIYTAILFEPLPIAGWAAMAGLAWLSLLALASITFLAGVLTASMVAAAGIGFVALIVLSIASAVPTLTRYLPGGVAEPAISLAAGVGSTDGGVLATSVIATVLCAAVPLVASGIAFRRREL